MRIVNAGGDQAIKMEGSRGGGKEIKMEGNRGGGQDIKMEGNRGGGQDIKMEGNRGGQILLLGQQHLGRRFNRKEASVWIIGSRQ